MSARSRRGPPDRVLGVLTSFDGGRLFGQVYGSEPPMVLALHGWRRDHRDFASVLSGVARHEELRVAGDLPLPECSLPSVALDLPGFGATPPPESEWGSREYAEAVARVLATFPDPVVLVGHSFGGRVAVRLAATVPDRVAGLLLTAAPLYAASLVGGPPPRRAPIEYRLVKALVSGHLLPARRLEQARQRHGSADYRAASGVMRGVLVRAVREEREAAYDDSLAALSCPVELVWGREDPDVPPAVAERIGQVLSVPPTVTVVPGAGHLTPLAIPGQLRGAIERLIAGVRR